MLGRPGLVQAHQTPCVTAGRSSTDDARQSRGRCSPTTLQSPGEVRPHTLLHGRELTVFT